MVICNLILAYIRFLSFFCFNETEAFDSSKTHDIIIKDYINNKEYQDGSIVKYAVGDKIEYSCELSNNTRFSHISEIRIHWRQEKGGVAITASKILYVKKFIMSAVLDSFDDESQWICTISYVENGVLNKTKETSFSLVEILDIEKARSYYQKQILSQNCSNIRVQDESPYNPDSQNTDPKETLLRITGKRIEKINSNYKPEYHTIVCIIGKEYSSSVPNALIGTFSRVVKYMTKPRYDYETYGGIAKNDDNNKINSARGVAENGEKDETKAGTGVGEKGGSTTNNENKSRLKKDSNGTDTKIIIGLAAAGVVVIAATITCLLRKRKQAVERVYASVNPVYAELEFTDDVSDSIPVRSDVPYAKIIGVVTKQNKIKT